jgi:hypothetical protein
MMKDNQRFKAPNYSRSCLLAKAFGVSAANSVGAHRSQQRSPSPIRTAIGDGQTPDVHTKAGAVMAAEALNKRNFIFFEMSGLKIFRKK